MTTRCLRCQYVRDGLTSGAACPECGEPAPPGDWIVLHGQTMSFDPRWSWVFASSSFAAVAGLGFGAWQQRSFPLLTMAIGFAVFGGVSLLMVALSWRRLREGGNLAWIVKPGSLEVRTSLRTLEVPWSGLHSALYERGFSRHQARLSVISRLDLSFGIWVNERDVDARRVNAIMRERINVAATLTPDSSKSASA